MYEYNEKISFARHGKALRHLLTGWSWTEDQWTWTEGLVAALALRVGPASGGLTLNVRMSGLLHPPELTVQPVQVLLNGTKITDWEVTDLKTYSVAIPSELLPTEPTDWVIDFLVPKATSPAHFIPGADSRRLALQVWDLTISTAPTPR
ncbi:MAG: hypothetical protein ABR589_00150 [Chthoniobacterales bacterium]